MAFEPELKKVLADPSIDAVIVDAPTNLHKDIMIEAARHKKQFSQKKCLLYLWKIAMRFFQRLKKPTFN